MAEEFLPPDNRTPNARRLAIRNQVLAARARFWQCLLAHGKGCENSFVARAASRATPWLEWTAQDDFGVGQLLSRRYAGTEKANAYTTRLLLGETEDVYDVKYSRRELTL